MGTFSSRNGDPKGRWSWVGSRGRKKFDIFLLIWWLVCLISQGRSFWTVFATIKKHQWFSGSSLPLNEWFGRNHWYQWFFNGFPLETMVFQWFPMVANHWSNDGMITIHRYGLFPAKHTISDDILLWRFKIMHARKTPLNFINPGGWWE